MPTFFFCGCFNFAVLIALPQWGFVVHTFFDTMLYHSEWWQPYLHPKWLWALLLFRRYCDVMPRSPISGRVVGRQPSAFVICLCCHITFPGEPLSNDLSAWRHKDQAPFIQIQTTWKGHSSFKTLQGLVETFVRTVPQPAFSLCAHLLPSLPSTAVISKITSY